MSRLTKKFDSGVGHNECHDSCMTCNGAPCELAQAMIDKLAYYEDLEKQLEKLYGGKMPLDEVVENLNRIVQNGEEKLDYARILTNAEAEKWDKWKNLEEQGRLIELPCEKVYCIINYDSPKHTFIDSIPIEMMPIYDLKHIDNGNIFFSTKEKAEAKLAESEEEPKEPEVDWSKVKVDTPILVSEYEDEEWVKRYFAKYEGGVVFAWTGGCTSWAAYGVTEWKYAKLAESDE